MLQTATGEFLCIYGGDSQSNAIFFFNSTNVTTAGAVYPRTSAESSLLKSLVFAGAICGWFNCAHQYYACIRVGKDIIVPAC